MISFSRQVKEEIVFNDFAPCCERALLLALLKINGHLEISNGAMVLTLRTENAKIAAKAHRLLKDLYQPEIEFLVAKKQKLKKNNVYLLRIHKAREILDDLGLMQEPVPSVYRLKKSCCLRAYLAGAFLAAGSVNDPATSNYHLEIAVSEESLAYFIRDLMEQFHLHAKTVTRRNKTVVYIKASERIADFLRIVGAPQSLFDFEEARIGRDFSNNINRWDNCVIANEMKSARTGAGQVADIELIDAYNGWADFDENTVLAARLRMENPDVSLTDLADLYFQKTGQTISKSGLHHRFKKIKDKASYYRLLQEEKQHEH